MHPLPRKHTHPHSHLRTLASPTHRHTHPQKTRSRAQFPEQPTCNERHCIRHHTSIRDPWATGASTRVFWLFSNRFGSWGKTLLIAAVIGSPKFTANQNFLGPKFQPRGGMEKRKHSHTHIHLHTNFRPFTHSPPSPHSHPLTHIHTTACLWETHVAPKTCGRQQQEETQMRDCRVGEWVKFHNIEVQRSSQLLKPSTSNA